MAQLPLLFLAFSLIFSGALFELSELLAAFKKGELIYGRNRIRLNRYDDPKTFQFEFRKLSTILIAILVACTVFMSLSIA